MIKRIIGIIKCCLVGHDVTEEDEDRLFESNFWMINARCRRCGNEVVLQKDPTADDYYLIIEI
jgi:hypothetical protein